MIKKNAWTTPSGVFTKPEDALGKAFHWCTEDSETYFWVATNCRFVTCLNGDEHSAETPDKLLEAIAGLLPVGPIVYVLEVNIDNNVLAVPAQWVPSLELWRCTFPNGTALCRRKVAPDTQDNRVTMSAFLAQQKSIDTNIQDVYKHRMAALTEYKNWFESIALAAPVSD